MEVGIRELRSRLSRYVRLVASGTEITVTDRGRPVARLTPISEPRRIDRLIADGRVHPPAAPKRPLDFEPIEAAGTVSDLVRHED